VLLSPAHPLRGGIAASTERIAQELLEMGNEVMIVSYYLQYPTLLFPGKSQFSDDPPPARLTIRALLSSINPLSWWRAARAIRQFKPNRILVRYWLPFMAPSLGMTLFLSRQWLGESCTRVALVDNLIPHEKRLGDRFLTRFFVRNCDAFVAMTTSVATDIQGFTGKNLSVPVVPHPVYDQYGEIIEEKEARFRLGLPETGSYILFFGLIRRYKGLDILLEALTYCPEVKLIIAGECYEDWNQYVQKITDSKLNDRVWTFPEFIPNDRVAWFFSAANLVVQPYRTATQSGISQIAYHFNRPMIVTDVGGLPELVTHGVSGYVSPPNAIEIAANIRRFFEPGTAARMALGVEQEKKRFSWYNLCQVLLQAGS
jgi:glycosyltransferase involved in cell wall biosynthesis